VVSIDLAIPRESVFQNFPKEAGDFQEKSRIEEECSQKNPNFTPHQKPLHILNSRSVKE
jgi:hypothetical protein